MKRSDWFSIIALALSLTACIITWLRVEIYTTNDTFVGLMSGFMGACATLIVGVQIYNSIEAKSKLKEIENTQHLLQQQLKEAQDERKISEITMQYLIHRAQGLSIHYIQTYTAYAFFFKSLEYALESDYSEYINQALHDLEVLLVKMREQKTKANHKDTNKIKELSIEKLTNYKSFNLIKDRYLSVYNKTIEYMEKQEKS